MPKKKGKDIFARIERVYGQIPKCLVVILRSCGFDNALAVEFIDEKAIEEIESHMQESGKVIIAAAATHTKSKSYLNLHQATSVQFLQSHKKLVN